jgi:hypothetical protein
MENSILNGLELYRGKWFSDLVDENMLSNALLTKPHEVSSIISYVFGTMDNGYSSTLDFFTGGLGKTMTIDQREYRWKVMIDSDRAVTIRGAKWNGSAVAANTTGVGGSNTPIQIWLEDKW